MYLERGHLFQVLIGLLILAALIGRQNTLATQEFYIDNQTCQLYYDTAEFYIEYGGGRHGLLLDKEKTFIDIASGDINGDGRDEILTLIGNRGSDYGEELVIYGVEINSNKLLIKQQYRNHIQAINPWKIEICEIDGDGEPEIFIGVNKATRYYTEIENRPFFFNYRDNRLVKKWTGSKLRASFSQVYFADLSGNGRDEFIVIEEGKEGGSTVTVYYWFGFGFILQAESATYKSIEAVSIIELNQQTLLQAEVKSGYRFKEVILEPSREKNENEIYMLKERGL